MIATFKFGSYSTSVYLALLKENGRYVTVSKSIYLFINNYLVPFKVTLLKYNTFMPAFLLILKTLLKCVWYRRQHLFRFFFYLLNRKKTIISGLVRGKIQWGPSLVNTEVEAWLRFCFWLETHGQAGAWLLHTFLTYYFAQSAHNLKVVFLIDRTILWREFMMHHVNAIEENNKQNLHIWSNLRSVVVNV